MAEVIPLRNLQDASELHDTLHNRQVKYKDTGCHPAHCMGSHLWPKEHKPKRPYGHPRPKHEVTSLADDFIRQYYEAQKTALGNNYEEKLSQRLTQVHDEIEEKGHYELTYGELAFGARTAWRNAPRCVNRIVWRQLEVLDARTANTAEDMFDAICHHIKYATNGGNLRSTITVFRQRTKPKSDFRVWNSQLFRYAGYKQEDGSILGDPSNVEFTQMCEWLGWQPPKIRSAFDVLPLVLQANGEDPQWFELPAEIITEVQLSHPDYPWFEELGLRWFGVPAVSNIMLDIGGLEFTAAPFNGWFMNTEVGRNLGDIDRYNKLKPIAENLKLDTQVCKLWKDKAMVELNIAVLHSFQKANVSIVDHHSATESFMTHIKAEAQARGGCPADWVWIVPPISGSLTPVFHQEMLLYYMTPSYEYQDDPWKHHPMGKHNGRSRNSLKLKTVASLIRDTNKMYRKFYQMRVKATILYATETGRSHSYANIVKDAFGKAFATKVVCMEDYHCSNLEHEQLLVLVTSTFGSGDPPANGEAFGHYLQDLCNRALTSSRKMDNLEPGRRSVDQPFTQLKYAVFGLGSRAYPNFCAFAHTCDNLLKKLGAKQISVCGEGDELRGQEESFQLWLKQCYVRACETYKLDPQLEEGEQLGFQPSYSEDNYQVKRFDGAVPERDVCANLQNVHSKEVYPAILKSRSNLQSPQSDHSTILVVLDTNDMQLHHVPGDHIAIYPQNNTKLVDELLKHLTIPYNPDESIYLECRRKLSTDGLSNWSEERRLPVPVTVREALTQYLDITNPPTPQFLELLVKQADEVADQEELKELAKGGQKYEDWKYERFPNLIDVLDQFRSVQINITLLLQQLPLLQCRYYSISSSRKMHPNEIHATVAVVSFIKRGATEAMHYGVCSTWLNSIEPGTVVPCFIRKAHGFHMPTDPKAPVILVGPGTGIAPFRAFWQERMSVMNQSLKLQREDSHQPGSVATVEETQQLYGNMTLYFGCRQSEMDFIYKEELKCAEESGALSAVHVALSRQPAQPKTYVQDLLKENADMVVKDLLEESGHIYVCGDISMAASVRKTVQDIFEEKAAVLPEEAVKLIKVEGFYHEDIFGVTLKTAEVTKQVRSAAKRRWAILKGSTMKEKKNT